MAVAGGAVARFGLGLERHWRRGRARVYVRACVCVCVCERERERVVWESVRNCWWCCNGR